MSKRPSGAQQRKTKLAREKLRQSLAGSMLSYLKRPRLDEDAGEGTSKDTAVLQTPVYKLAGSSSAMHFVEEKGVPVEERTEQQEEQGVEMSLTGDPAAEESVTEPQKDMQMFSDVAFWEIPVPDLFRVEIVRMGSVPFQNKEGPFKRVARKGEQTKGGMRHLTTNWFYRVMPSGEKVLRSWMVYSPVSEKLYCFCCRLFATSVTGMTSHFVTGFQVWWRLNPKVKKHENSSGHRNCLQKWTALVAGLKHYKTIDSEAVAATQKMKKRGRYILYRAMVFSGFLARQNIPFRGHIENASSLNKGNFLEGIDMLSVLDPVLKEYLTELQQSKKKLSVSYLSPNSQNEILEIMGNHIKEILIKEIKSAEFFGMMFDTTPDISHTDQMSEVIRYVKIQDKEVEVKEVFLGFFPLEGKKAVDLTAEILEALKRDGLDIMNCRSQGYDNAASMAGIYGGVQALIREKNPKAIFNGCVDHSLNLCGQHSFAENAKCDYFFVTLDSLFSLFSSSAQRWNILLAHTGTTLKWLSKTRWDAHYAAVKPVTEKYDEILGAVKVLSEQPAKLGVRGTASQVLERLRNFTFLCFLYFWCDILQEVHDTQQYLQIKGLPLDKVVARLEALKLFLQEQRNNLVENAIQRALVKAKKHNISVEKRVAIVKMMPGEKARDAGLALQKANRRAMFECIDRFYSELQRRARGFNEVAAMFEAVQMRSLISATNKELQVSVPKLTTFYNEISESELQTEIERLRRYLTAAQIDLGKAKDWGALDVLKFIAEWKYFDSLPNLSRSLRLFLTICVSVASCERSFSKLKLIKSYLRSTMGQARLSALAIVSIESELAKYTNFDVLMEKFATVKNRKVPI